jgi:hypothetical protein
VSESVGVRVLRLREREISLSVRVGKREGARKGERDVNN